MRTTPLLLAVMALVSFPASAATASDQSLLTSGNVNLDSETIAGGALVGGNFTANSSTVGAGLGSAADNKTVLQVGGNFQYNNSTMPHGGVLYSGTNTSDVGQGYSNQVKTPNGSVTQGALTTNLAAEFANAMTASHSLSTLSKTGTFAEVNNDGIGRLEGLTSGLNVFSLTADDLASITTLRFFGNADATTSVVINVDATSYSNFLAVDLNNLVSSDKLVFNFANATSLSLGGWNLPGTLLAPDATVNQQGGSIAGGLVAANFIGNGGAIDGTGFYPTLASVSAAPEPAAWAMMILGFGVAGATLRRRKAPPKVSAAR